MVRHGDSLGECAGQGRMAKGYQGIVKESIEVSNGDRPNSAPGRRPAGAGRERTRPVVRDGARSRLPGINSTPEGAKPIGAGEDRAEEKQEDDRQDQATAHARARAAAAEPKTVLQPIKDSSQKGQL